MDISDLIDKNNIKNQMKALDQICLKVKNAQANEVYETFEKFVKLYNMTIVNYINFEQLNTVLFSSLLSF